VSLPHWRLCVTLGGVTTTQVGAVAVALAAHLALMSQIGTLCSVYFTTTGRACVASMIILFLLLLGPPIAEELLRELHLLSRSNNFFAPMYRNMAPFQLAMLVSPGYAGGLITTQVWTNMLASVALFAVSWLLLDRVNTYDPAPGRESKLLARLKSLLPESMLLKRPPRRAPVGPVGGAILWKDFRQFGGGYRWWLFRAIGFVCMGLLFSLDGWGRLWQRVGVGLIVTAFWAGIAEIVFHAGHLLHREIKNQTWDSLRMLPVSTSSIVRRKIMAALWAMVPTFAALFLGMLMEKRLFEEIFREFDRHPVISSCVTIYCIAGTILAVYLTCYFSLRVNPWLGTVIAAGLFGFLTSTPFMCCFGLMNLDGNSTAGFVFFFAAFFDLAIAAGFHLPISATLNGETNG